MYQALYRKYRPGCFDEVAGQQHVTETLRRQVMTDKLSHAYLFIGTRGTGKTTCARILSRAVNCLKPQDGNPCNECASCTGIEGGTILDVVELDAASNNGVDDVREWRHDVVYSPATAKKRVFIVDEVHMLSKEAFNALLKILEEPPQHLIFILATTELHKVLPTIQSRCQKFMFKRLPREEIAARLQVIAEKEGLIIEKQAASLLAGLADGSMRDGISLLDQCASGEIIDLKHVQDTLGLIADDRMTQIIRSIANNNALAVLEAVDWLYKDGKDMTALISELSAALRDLLVMKLDPDSSLISSTISRDEMFSLSKLMTGERLLNCMDIAKNTLLGLSRTGISRSVLEMCLIRMSDERLSDDIPSLLARIARLEALFAAGPPPSAAPAAVPAPAPVPMPEPVSSGLPAAPAAQPVPSAQPAQPASSELPARPAPAAPPASSPATSPVHPPAPSHALSPPLEPEPAPSSEPAASNAAPVINADDVLPAVLGSIDDISLRVFLQDSNKAHAKIENGILVITMTDDYNAGLIKASFMDALSEAAEKTFGKEMIIRINIQEGISEEEKQNKLNSLMSFGDIVKIE